MTYNGVIEDSTGDLLRAGYTDFVAGTGETIKTNVPNPGKIRDTRPGRMFPKMHRWTGSAWEEVNQPAIVPTTFMTMLSPDGTEWKVSISNAGALVIE